MKINVDVTAEDITNSIRMSPLKCPVASALNRVVPKKGAYASVGVTFGHFELGNCKTVMFELPEEVSQFITRFDSCFPVKPFTFELEVVE